MADHEIMDILLTVDTELSAALHQQGKSPSANFDSSILGRCAAGDFGIVHQMERLETHGQKGVFFVDPMPALVYGEQIIADIVGPIIERKHEVQLHLHTEWLQWARDSPVGNRQGRNLLDFNFKDQVELLRLANDLLIKGGAPPPTAFRAGNFGANDNSLRALHHIGLKWDSSFSPCSVMEDCKIDLPENQIVPTLKNGIVELPVSGIFSKPMEVRPAQICALSIAEMKAAMDHAIEDGHPAFVIVTHSFEALSRDRLRVNRSVLKRFEQIAAYISENRNMRTSGFGDLSAKKMLAHHNNFTRLEPKTLRTTMRMVEQLWSTWRFERSMKPL